MSNPEIDSTFVSLTFIAIGIGVSLVILFGVFMTRKNKLVNEQLKKELEHQKRIHAAELHALRGQMNPHFVHNSLNAIQYYIQRNEVETSENYLAKFSKLIRLFFEYSRRQFISISEEMDLLVLYLEIEKLRFEDKISFHIEVDRTIDPDEQTVPAMILQPIVENAVNHGLFHKGGEGEITVHFKLIDGSVLQIVIEDDGIGINEARRISGKGLKKEGSHSMKVLEERLELLALTKQWETHYAIDDLSDPSVDGNKTGTRVTLNFNQNTDV